MITNQGLTPFTPENSDSDNKDEQLIIPSPNCWIRPVSSFLSAMITNQGLTPFTSYIVFSKEYLISLITVRLVS